MSKTKDSNSTDFLQKPVLFQPSELSTVIQSLSSICDTSLSFIISLSEGKKDVLTMNGSKGISTDTSFLNHPLFTIEEITIELEQNGSLLSTVPLTIDNILVSFFAGIPLFNSDMQIQAILCTVDKNMRELNESQLQLMKTLKEQAESIMQLNADLKKKEETIEKLSHTIAILNESQQLNQIGSWTLDIDSGKTEWTEEVYRIHEVPLDFDHNKVNGIEFYHPDDRETITEAIMHSIQTGEPFDVTCRFITAKGFLKWVRSTGRKVVEENGKVFLRGSFQDITEIKQNELKYKGIFNSSFSFMGFLNPKGILLDVNHTALVMADLKREDVVGKYFWECYWWQISEDLQINLKKNIDRVVKEKKEVVEEVKVWIANKQPITILFSLRPILDTNNNVVYIIPEGRPIQEIVDVRNRNQSIIEGTHAGTWEWNVQTGETVMDERWAEIVGYKLEELEPISIRTWQKLVHPEDREKSTRQLQNCFDNKVKFYEIEVRMKHKDGHWVWVHDRGKVFSWTLDGKPLMMYGTHQDITTRKNIEEELRISEEAFRGNFENAAIGMALLNEQGQWLKVNKRVSEIVGYSEEELMNLTFQDITHPEDLETDLTLLQELVAGERAHYQMEKRYFHKKGHIVNIILAVSKVTNTKGDVLYFISQIIDISELKQAEYNLSKALAKNKAILDASTQVAIISTDVEGTIEEFNDGAVNMLGYASNEVVGKHTPRIFLSGKEQDSDSDSSEKEETCLIEQHLERVTKGQSDKFESYFKRKDGRVFPVLLSMTGIRQGYKQTGFLWVAVDISQLKSAQKKLEHKNEELEQFAYVAAHDLQEPLRVISGYLSLLQKKYSLELDEKANQYIDITIDGATRMKTLINDILDYSKADITEYIDLDLNLLVKKIVSIYGNSVKNNKMSVTVEDLPVISGDETSMSQLFTNLIGNGLKYQTENAVPEIKINAEEKENMWEFRIADNGIGIDPKHYKRVFEIFKRLHSKSEYPGTGIGLATCKKIVTSYGGKIWIEPNTPHGTVFVFTLPKK